MKKFWKLAQTVIRNNWAKTNHSRSLFAVAKRPLFSNNRSKCLQICLVSAIIPHGKINVEDDLRQAINEGERAIVELMNELHDLVISVSKAYRSHLGKQIELIQITGDEASHELLEFRAVADELNNELNEYVILLRAIGDIAYDQTMLSLMLDQNALVTILKRYKELEIVLLQEFEANKQMEMQLLEVNIASIASRGINSDS